MQKKNPKKRHSEPWFETFRNNYLIWHPVAFWSETDHWLLQKHIHENKQ
jgi:hypothetical protein